MHTRYVITRVIKELRYMVGANNYYSTYLTKEIAEQKLKDIIENNNPDTIEQLMGTDLKVLPVECYPSGDSTKTVFSV
jgi:hypothetical protein